MSDRAAAERRLREFLEQAHAPGQRAGLLRDLELLAAVPPLVGVTRASEILRVQTSNLDGVRGLPEPVQRVENGRLWEQSVIQRLADNPVPPPPRPRRTHCPQGHEMTAENTNSEGKCKVCKSAQVSAARKRRRESANQGDQEGT